MIYTDGNRMIADKEEELHQFAASFGMKRRWYYDKGFMLKPQFCAAYPNPHDCNEMPFYPIWGNTRKLIMRSGVKYVSRKELNDLAKKMKEASRG